MVYKYYKKTSNKGVESIDETIKEVGKGIKKKNVKPTPSSIVNKII